MKLIWHIFKKDFRRLRWPWACWTVLIVAQYVVANAMLGDGSVEHDNFVRLGGMEGLISMVVMVVGYFLVAQLVVEDSLVNPKAFWMPRPISGWRLLGAKVLGTGALFMVWPAVVAMPWWVYSGFGLPEIGRAAVQTALIQTLFIVPAFVLAALAGSVSRFFLWTLVILVGAVTVFLNALVSPVLTETLKQTRGHLVLLVGGLTGVAVVVLQFGTRRILRSMAVFLSGLGLCVLIAMVWPWDLYPAHPRPGPQLAGTEALTVGLKKADANRSRSDVSFNLSLVAKGMPEDRGIVSGWADVELRWPDGTMVHNRGSVSVTGFPQLLRDARSWFDVPQEKPDGETEPKLAELRAKQTERINVFRAGRGLPPLPVPQDGAPDRNVHLNARLRFPPDLATRFADSEPAATITVHLEIGQPVTLVQMPLEAGITRTGHGLRMRLLHTRLQLPRGFDHARFGKMHAVVVYSTPRGMNPIFYYLLNRTHGTVEGLWGERPRTAFSGSIGLTQVWAELRIPMARLWRDNQWVDDPVWHQDDELAVVSSRTLGAIDRTITIEHLKITQHP